MHSVMPRSVIATIVEVESSKFYILSICNCSLGYPACNAHAPYRNLLPVRLYCIFQHYLINDTIFGEKSSLKVKYVFWFSLQRLYATFLILRTNEQRTEVLISP